MVWNGIDFLDPGRDGTLVYLGTTRRLFQWLNSVTVPGVGCILGALNQTPQLIGNFARCSHLSRNFVFSQQLH
jgi:hypothetical protein